MTADGPCAWASLAPPICTACVPVEAFDDRPFDESPAGAGEILCAHKFLFSTPTEGHCVQCGAPYREEIAA